MELLADRSIHSKWCYCHDRDVLMYGAHHMNPIKPWGEGWIMEYHGCMASTDYNNMTRLVVISHDFGIRSEIIVRGMRMYIAVHKRDPESNNISLGHPSLSDAIDTTRRYTSKWMKQYQPNTTLVSNILFADIDVPPSPPPPPPGRKLGGPIDPPF